MPNHVHGIIGLRDANKKISRKGVQIIALRDENKKSSGRGVQLNAPTGKNISPKKGTLSVIVRTYKAAVTTICRDKGFPKFRWHRNFHEHIIRDQKDLDRIRRYILENPIKWFYDEENPANAKS